jgi:hypothetical protein
MSKANPKFEVGKIYKTRHGSRARILANDVKGMAPYVAAIKHKDTEMVFQYYRDGRMWRTMDSDFDLMLPGARATKGNG